MITEGIQKQKVRDEKAIEYSETVKVYRLQLYQKLTKQAQ